MSEEKTKEEIAIEAGIAFADALDPLVEKRNYSMENPHNKAYSAVCDWISFAVDKWREEGKAMRKNALP